MKDKRIAMKPMIQSNAVFQQFLYLCLYRWLTPKGRSLVVDYLFKHSWITDPNNMWNGRLKPTTSLIDLYRGKTSIQQQTPFVKKKTLYRNRKTGNNWEEGNSLQSFPVYFLCYWLIEDRKCAIHEWIVATYNRWAIGRKTQQRLPHNLIQ